MKLLTTMLFFALLSAGCGSRSESISTETPVDKLSPARQDPRVVLEVVSVNAHSNRYAGQTFWTYVPTLKVKVTATESLPDKQDVWIWVVFVSGSGNAKELADWMASSRSKLAQIAPDPVTYTLSVQRTSPVVDEKEYTAKRSLISVKLNSLTPPAPVQHPINFSIFLMPKNPKDRWLTSADSEISFPLQAFDLKELTDTLSEGKSPQPPEARGMAAIALCTFQSGDKTSLKELSKSAPAQDTTNPQKERDNAAVTAEFKNEAADKTDRTVVLLSEPVVVNLSPEIPGANDKSKP